MKTKPTTKPGFGPQKMRGLLAASLLLATDPSAFCGDATTTQSIAAPAMDANPLSFLDGKVVFDFQERLRWENRSNNYDFNSATRSVTDGNWFEQRLRIGVALKPVNWLKIYAQGQDSREFNALRGNTPGVSGAEGDDAFDLRQGYVEIGNLKEFPLTLTLGRQILSYGDERLVGSFDWNNIGRTFDAVKLHLQQPKWWLDAFASSVVVPTRSKYDQSDLFNGNETDRGQVFSGVYFSTTVIPVQTTDLYAFNLHESTGPKYQPTALGDTNFLTIGIRVKSNPGAFYHESAPAADGKSVADGKSAPAPMMMPKPFGFDYEGEYAFQAGKVRGLDLTAFALHTGLGYTIECPWSPRLSVEYNYASGDTNPNDGTIETFQNLFPTNHLFYGYMDTFAWQNMRNPAARLTLAPCKKVTAELTYNGFWLATNEDSWYRANGVTTVRPLNAAATNANKYAGSEIDVKLSYKPIKPLALEAGYSHFFAGAYLKDTGAHSDANFFYLQTKIDF